MTNIAFIPARGGSKGVVDKNIRNINGFPLIFWSIQQALKSVKVSEVYVSTDSMQIAELAKKFGAKVPFLRPTILASDTASTESAMMHFANWLSKSNDNVQNLILLQPTSPIRLVKTLDSALEFFEETKCDSLLSVTKSHKFCWKKSETDFGTAQYDFKNRPRRQDIRTQDQNYIETGSIYISNFAKFLHEKNRLFGNIALFETSECEAYEIDTLMDFKICEQIMRELGW